jgi:hypothetical protein
VRVHAHGEVSERRRREMKPLLPVMKEKVSFGTQLFNAFILTFFVAISPLSYFFLFCFFL